MKKFNFFIAAYFIFLFLLFIINAILEASTEYALIMIYYPYLYYIAVLLIIIKGWEMLIRIMNTFGSNSLASLFGKFIIIGIGLFATLWIFVMVLFFGGYASSKKYEDLNLLAYDSPNKLNKTEYIVIERGAFAATTNYYHERYNLFLMKKKESYSHKI
ncbi:hypothetical protein [Gemella haemolysans]|jgi:hypothetical protein|uniref:Uncharacterized protein n=2 Tax=Gemella haemolysans TaxID=1379 RepID=A0AA87AIC9_9BACL|nr:hypothetical protein [Gemella haemolysans]EGF85591.1 hypothetical protein HMPREF0428_00755 [Gemella haemolysans M341]QIX87436.1 hypothetical protein FOC48_01065 [Gemella haemolysans]